MDIPARGSCQCGSVTFTVTAEPIMHYACHFHSCQKRGGGVDGAIHRAALDVCLEAIRNTTRYQQKTPE